MRPFLVCIAPAILAYIILLVSGGASSADFLSIVITLIVIGAAMSGICVAAYVHNSMQPKGETSGVKLLCFILTFLGVGVVYLAVGLAGCCSIASMTSTIK